MSPVSTPLSLLPGDPLATWLTRRRDIFFKVKSVWLIYAFYRLHWLKYCKHSCRVSRNTKHNKNWILGILTVMYGANSNARDTVHCMLTLCVCTSSRHWSPCLSRHFPSSLEKCGAKPSQLQQAWPVSALFHSVQRHNQTVYARPLTKGNTW